MSVLPVLIGPVSRIIDRILPDAEARNRAKLELLQLEGTQEMAVLQQQMAVMLAETQSADPWTSRARPGFLYVMYALFLWAIPMGLIAAADPQASVAIAHGMTAYLQGLPEPLYALFGTGYLGYTAARQWGKMKGVDK